MFIEQFSVTVTTDADGNATAYLGPVRGRPLALLYRKIDFADTVDFTITTEDTARNLWVESNVTASADRAPRMPTHDTVGAASLYAAAGEPVEDLIPIANERIKIAIAGGGDTKSGDFHALIG